MEMRVEPETEGHLKMLSCTLKIEHRDSIPLLDGRLETTNDYVAICSWCKKIRVEDRWCEAEEAITRLGLLNETPGLTHGICPACTADVLRRFEGA